MIDSVGWDIVEDWDWEWLKKKRKNYRVLIVPEWLEGVWNLLCKKDWCSLQTINDEDKKISTIAPVVGMTNLRTLILQNNLIEDLSPLSGMMQLRSLSCYINRIRDLSPLANLTALEDVSLGGNPVESFEVLEKLPKLRRLTISTRQVTVFRRCKRLLQLEKLTIDCCEYDTFDHFLGFPEMPSLKMLQAWHVKDTAGLERFPTLLNLCLPGGKASSLEALRRLKALTHFSISTSKAIDAEPLGGLNALRSLSLNGPKVSGLKALNGLPALHKISLDDESTADAEELRVLRDGMTSWDIEFKTGEKRSRPSLDIEVVDQATFDYYDSNAAFGILPGECNEKLLDDSERNWLLARIADALSVKFEGEKDFHLPYTSGFQRTERVIIYGFRAYESFREVALALQEILCSTRNDWIIWCQSLLWEGPEEQEIPDYAEDFTVWIYPDKIMATKENAAIVRKLIEWRK
ncbi:MAG: leucine-rich repeat domain-containing protein [Verrucomicrobiota bacterium]